MASEDWEDDDDKSYQFDYKQMITDQQDDDVGKNWRVNIREHSDHCHTYSFVRRRVTMRAMFQYAYIWFIPLVYWACRQFWNAGNVWPFSAKVLIILATYCLVVLICIWIFQSYNVYKETVSIIRGFGIQVITDYSSGTQVVQFYSADRVYGIFVNEGISMHSIFYYMVLVLRRDDDLTDVQPLFKHSMPRLHLLMVLYTSMLNTLEYNAAG